MTFDQHWWGGSLRSQTVMCQGWDSGLRVWIPHPLWPGVRFVISSHLNFLICIAPTSQSCVWGLNEIMHETYSKEFSAHSKHLLHINFHHYYYLVQWAAVVKHGIQQSHIWYDFCVQITVLNFALDSVEGNMSSNLNSNKLLAFLYCLLCVKCFLYIFSCNFSTSYKNVGTWGRYCFKSPFYR